MNKIAFIGSGNISFHLSKSFKDIGHTIISISSRNESSGKELAKAVSAAFIPIEKISPGIDLLIIAVSDDAIAKVIPLIPKDIKAVVHTSGSIPISIFQDHFLNCGVFYPLQSFTKKRSVDFKNIPILVEASNVAFEKQLVKLASDLSNTVKVMDSKSRLYLHLAAVIANNFVNYLATEAYEILEDQKIDGSLIRPLMLESILRLENNHPIEMQTGPAKRNDKEVLKKHEELLNSKPKLQSLYRQISQLIMQRYNGSEL